MRHRPKPARPAAASSTVQPAMDINKWLAGTAEAVGPARRPDQPGYPGGRKRGTAAPVVDLQSSTTRRPKIHQDGAKDSSILAPEDVPTELPARPIPIARHAYQDGGEAVPSKHAAQSSQHGNDDESGANTYRRKKRHKTRADRYGPQLRRRENGAENQHGEKHKPKPARKNREAKRSKKDKSAPVIVRNFHAANVPRTRLTLQPRASVGIFKNGKASSPFRSRGLPDLAFSEMNFLSKRTFTAEENANTEETNKRRKKDRRRATEEEISSYFAPKRPRLVEKSINELTPRETVSEAEIQHLIPRRDSTVPSIMPIIEKPASDKLDDTKTGPASASNTYFTWSDSLRQSSQAAVVRPVSATDLEACGARLMSTFGTGNKVRASSYDLRPPDLVEKRRSVRSQTTRDRKQNLTNSNLNLNLLHDDVTTSPSLPRLNQLRRPTLQGAASGSDDLPRTARGRTRSICSHLSPVVISTLPEVAHQEQPSIQRDTRIAKTDDLTPLTDSQDPTWTSMANLLNDCDSAYRNNCNGHIPRLQPAHLEHRTELQNANKASTIRHVHHVHNFGESGAEVEDEHVLSKAQDDDFFDSHGLQIQDLQMLEEQHHIFELNEEETSLYMRPNVMEYNEQVQLSRPITPTRWLRYETHYRPATQHALMGGIWMRDLEEEGEQEEEEEQALEQFGIVEEVEEEHGMTGFWKPNMLY